MEQGTPENLVRPVEPARQPIEPQRRPSIITIVLLLITGASAGYLAGLPADGVAAAARIEGAAGSGTESIDPAPVAHYDWVEQVPPDNSERWAVRTGVELEGSVYLLVLNSFEDRLSRAVWESTDGRHWQLVPTDLGPDALITDLDVYEGELIMSGWIGNTPTLWRSNQTGADADVAWTTITLSGAPADLGDLVSESSILTTEVNSDGEIVVLADFQMSINDLVVDLSTDPSVVSRFHFDELPEIAAETSRVWIKLVDPGGVESIHFADVAPTISIEPVSGRLGMEVGPIRAWALWTSRDGWDFGAVTPPSGLNVAPSVMALGESFIASAAGAGNRFDLWLSADGTAWEQNPWSIPAECGKARPVTVSGDRVIAISETFDHLCSTENGSTWDTQESPGTAIEPDAFVAMSGGTGRSLMATIFDPPEQRMLMSTDGLEWRPVTYEPEMTGGRTLVVGERLVTVARSRDPEAPRSWRAWIGEPAD